MQIPSLALESPSPYIVRPGPVTVALVGCGGTGSHLAQTLARIAAHFGANGAPPPRIILVDGDTVERKNVGRQLFTHGDIGTNKAIALAERFGRLFGLRIEAVPRMADLELLRRLVADEVYDGQRLRLLVGAVDTVVARRTLHEALNQQTWHLWLDCGNHDYSGQVSVGSTTDPKRLAGAIRAGLCTALPAPSLTDPDLLESDERRRVVACAAAVDANLQGLMVNTQVAAIAAVYLDRLMVHRQIPYFRTSFAQEAMSMRSLPVTPPALAEVARRYQEHQAAKAVAKAAAKSRKKAAA